MEASKLSLPFEPQQEVPVDWSDLPADLVATISKKLHDLFDFVYFHAVCKKWRTATSISELPPQFPWILEWHNNEHLRIYSLINGKSRTIRCPKTYGMRFDGPSHGYLYRDIDNRKKYLLNPLTNDEVSFKLEDDYSGNLLCMSPDLMGSYDHIAFYDEYNWENVGFYQPRNQEWCYVQLPLLDVCSIDSQACFRGHHLINTDTGNTLVTKIASRSTFSVPSPDVLNNLGFVYFVESRGKILRIVKRLDYNSDLSNFNYSFEIYQLDVIDKNCGYRWLRTSSIGNQILFLDWQQHCGISITACETAGLRENCIYCLESCYDRIFDSKVEVYRYNIEDGQTEMIFSRFNHNSIWFVPHIIGSLLVDPC